MNQEEAYRAFQWKLDGSEPCRQPFDKDGNPNDPEKWTGNWVNSTEPEVAEELCEECHVKNECLIYALIGKEKDFIWGGTTPQQRKEILDARRSNTKKANSRPASHPKRKNKAD